MNAEDRTRALKLAAAYPEGGEGSMSSLLAYHVRLYEETLRATEEESRMLREALGQIKYEYEQGGGLVRFASVAYNQAYNALRDESA